jgi:Flp pilus assembly protein TadD
MSLLNHRQLRIIRNHPAFAALFLLAAAGLIAYGNALPNSFHFDDIVGIVRNPTLRDLRNIPAYFTDPATFGLGRAREWRPILQITYALNYAMAELDPVVFRSFNLLFHIGTAFVLFLIVCQIGTLWPRALGFHPPVRPRVLALSCALLFVVHTANSEAVDYIWARSSQLATFFYVLAFYCYLRGPFGCQNQSHRSWLLAGFISFALGVGTKATAIVLPVLLFFYEWLFLNPASVNPFKLFLGEPQRLKKYISLAIVVSAYMTIRILLLPKMFTNIAVTGGVREVSSYSYLLTQFRAWLYYIRLFLWPHPLIMDYSSFGWSHSLAEIRVLASLVLILIILICAWWARQRHPLLALFTFWYFIALLPEASVIPLGDAVVGYRAYPAYVALAVVSVMLSFHGASILRRMVATPIAESSSGFGFSYGSVMGLVLIALTVATVARNRDWRDERTLWTDVLTKDPSNVRAYRALGLEALIRADYEQARLYFDRAAQLTPNDSHTYVLRGYLNSRLDRNDLALSDYSMAIKFDRRSPYGFFYRGELYRKLGQPDEALADYAAALNYMPYYADAYLGAAMAYLDKNNLAAATQACARLLDIDGEDRRGYDCLGTLLMEQGRVVDAIRTYELAVARIADDGELWRSLAEAYQKNGMTQEAAAAIEKSKRIVSRKLRQPSKALPLIQ